HGRTEHVGETKNGMKLARVAILLQTRSRLLDAGEPRLGIRLLERQREEPDRNLISPRRVGIAHADRHGGADLTTVEAHPAPGEIAAERTRDGGQNDVVQRAAETALDEPKLGEWHREPLDSPIRSYLAVDRREPRRPNERV